MDSIQGAVGISFWELERAVFGRFLEVMAEGMAQILQAIDDRIAEERDKQRYEIRRDAEPCRGAASRSRSWRTGGHVGGPGTISKAWGAGREG
ncbi:MAG: UPF0236 family transposase-like protein [Bacillota bacterium]